ncbi:MAG: hypothetical protein HKO60_06925 [Pseudomonadales bacterium]|nr:hypothetical protein [Pseudomonadales bacterium]
MLLLLVCLCIGFIVGTETGSGWLLGAVEKQLASRISGSSVEPGAPRALRKGLSIQRLYIPGEANGTPLVDMQAFNLQLAFRCRAGIWLCVNKLSIDALQLSLPQSDSKDEVETDEPATTISLPDIEAPFGILLASLKVGALTIHGSPATHYLQDVAINGDDLSWRGKKLSIGSLQASQQYWRYQLAGNITTSDNYPIELNNVLEIEATASDELRAPIAINAKFEETLKDLRFEGSVATQNTTNPQRLAFDGNVAPLSPKLPLTINLQSETLDASQWLKNVEIAIVENLAVIAQGDLDNLDLQLRGDVAPMGAARAKASVHVTEQGNKKVSEQVSKKKTVTVPIIAVAQLQNRSEILLEQFKLGASGNQLSAQGKIDLSEGLLAKLQLGFDNFQPASLLPNPVETMQGNVELNLAYSNDGSPIKVDARLDQIALGIDGERYTASGTIKNDAQQNIRISRINIRAGQNSVEADGILAPINAESFSTPENTMRWLGAASLNASMAFPDLQSLPIEATGAVNASLTLRPGQAAKIVASAEDFASNAIALDTMQLNAALHTDFLSDSNAQNQIKLQGYGLRGNGVSLDEVALLASGNAGTHQLVFSGDGEEQHFGLQLQGRYIHSQSKWQGSLQPTASISPPAQEGTKQAQRHAIHVQSEQAIKLNIPLNGSKLSVGAFCLSINEARLCSDGDSINNNGDPELVFRLAALDLEAFRALLPAGLLWQGMLEGSATVAYPAQQAPTMQLNLVGSAGTIKSAQKRTPLELDYESISLALNANQEKLQASVLVQREQQPLLQSALTLSGKQFQALSGQVSISALPLGLFAPFAPTLETLQGQVDAQLNIGGTTAAPQLDGTLDLLNGQVKVSNNALALEQIALHGQFTDASLALDGSFRADKGTGEIKGNIDFSKPVAGVITLSGKQLGIRAEPELGLIADLDLKATLQAQRLTIGGEVAIPEGKIELVTLPADAKKLSRDVSFVDPSGGKKTTAASELAIEAKVALALGPKLLLNGFDASATLAGQLELEQAAGKAPTGSGEIKILEGKYRGFGQRLEVRTGSLLFNGALAEPNIYLEAIRRAEDAIAGIRVTGPAVNPRVEPFSEPSMPDDQIIYRIITGRAPGGSAGASQNAIIAQTLISQGIKIGGASIGSTAEKLGIENFNIGTGDGSDFQVSGYLDPTLYLEYGVNALGDGSTFKLRWDFARRLSLEFIGGLANSLDLFYSREF